LLVDSVESMMMHGLANPRFTVHTIPLRSVTFIFPFLSKHSTWFLQASTHKNLLHNI